MTRWLVKGIVYFAPWSFLIASLSRIGWEVKVVCRDDSDEVYGLIVGQPGFVDSYKKEESCRV